jgi:hypothetical protein
MLVSSTPVSCLHLDAWLGRMYACINVCLCIQVNMA